MIGRGGSSLARKNVLSVKGVPLLHWATDAAVRSKHIGRYYISSDDDEIMSTAGSAGYAAIQRPEELNTAIAQSADAVRHELGILNAMVLLILLLFNTQMWEQSPKKSSMIVFVSCWITQIFLQLCPVMKCQNITRNEAKNWTMTVV